MTHLRLLRSAATSVQIDTRMSAKSTERGFFKCLYSTLVLSNRTDKREYLLLCVQLRITCVMKMLAA